MYPSFDPVCVFVSGHGEGFRVHDGGGASRVAWDHGKDDAIIRRMLTRQSTNHQLKLLDDVLVAEISSSDWLIPAVLSVANASAAAAQSAVERAAAASDSDLRERIYHILAKVVGPTKLTRNYEVPGKSGKRHLFDYAISLDDEDWLLIDAVSPHHVSIAAKYVAFSDTKENGRTSRTRFAVYDRPLEADDVALMQQVADLVPVSGLHSGITREMQDAG